MNRHALTLLSTCAFATATIAQQYAVVPANRATTNAPAYNWIAGASRDVRQQTLIGQSHLTALVGTSITAIELRRHSANEQYLGGTADLTVTLSIAPIAPIECSATYANNTGTQGAPAFSGLITLPTSPAPTGGTIGWTTNNVVRIPLTTPFSYNGGTLCIDIVGHPVAGQNADWWMANLELEDISGTTTDLGGGCGIYGGAAKDWSHVARRSLLPGANARFSAYGTPYGLALAAFGTRSPIGIPLAATGLPGGAGCDLWLASLSSILPTLFMPPSDPADLSFGGEAQLQFTVPNSPAVFGFSMTTQWVDWSQMATSNAIEWTIANAAPTLDMAINEGHPAEAFGLAHVYMAHVMRFEYQ